MKKYELINELLNNFSKIKTDNTLFHYTSIESLCNGILQNDKVCLRASRCDSVNDLSELKEGYKTIKELWPELQIPSTFSDMQNKYYLLSFSENGNSLPMWCMYGNHGAGVNIGFKEIGNDFENGICAFKCLYSKEEAKTLFSTIMNYKCKSEVERSLKELSKLVVFSSIVYAYKSKYYDFEKEVRLIGQINNEIESVFVRDNELISYKNIYIPKEQIVSITIGPTTDQEKTEKFLRRVLDEKGFSHVEIVKSEIPYRR